MTGELKRSRLECVMSGKPFLTLILAVLVVLVLPHGTPLAQEEHFLVTHYPEYRPRYEKVNHEAAVNHAVAHGRVRVEKRVLREDKIFATGGPHDGQRVVIDHFGDVRRYEHKRRLEAEHNALSKHEVYQARGINTKTGRAERGFIRANDTATGVYYFNANGNLVEHYLPRDTNSFRFSGARAADAKRLAELGVFPSASPPMNAAMLSKLRSGEVRLVNGEFRLHTGELVWFDGGGRMRVVDNAQPAYGFVPPQPQGGAQNVSANVVQQVVHQQPVVNNIPGYQAPNSPLQ